MVRKKTGDVSHLSYRQTLICLVVLPARILQCLAARWVACAHVAGVSCDLDS